MGKSLEHLKQIHANPGERHYELNTGPGTPLPQSQSAEQVPKLPGGAAREKGSAVHGGGEKANIAPSQKPEGMGPCLSD